MKVILSRKGFDSGYGGIPSPILNSIPISLPIPTDISKENINSDFYKSLKLDPCLKLGDVHTYEDLILKLQNNKPGSVLYKSKNDKQPVPHKIDVEVGCHLDPDIYDKVIITRDTEWRGLFGQSGAAQGQLNNIKPNIKDGDLFLFFGWFKRAECDDGEIHYLKGAPDLHVIFGYLEIAEILTGSDFESTKFPEWAKYHPHFRDNRDNNEKQRANNTLYVASEHLSWDKSKRGWGVFRFDEKLVLTENDSVSNSTNLTRSKWKMQSMLKDENVTLSYHKMKECQVNENQPPYFQSSSRGQEFVFSEDDIVKDWAKDIINKHLTN